MRLYELILTEAISLSSLRIPLDKEIWEGIMHGTRQMYYKDKQIPPEVKAAAIQSGQMKQVRDIIQKEFQEYLEVYIGVGIEEVLRRRTTIQLDLKFANMKSMGSASGLTIYLSNAYITELVNDILAVIERITMDSLSNESEYYSVWFKTFKLLTKNELISYGRNIDHIVPRLISTTIHEMVHIQQHFNQASNDRPIAEYRSYLEKNLHKFHTAIEKIHAGTATPNDYKIYLASPQEITAHAHNAALLFIESTGIDHLGDIANIEEYLAEIRRTLPQEMRWAANKMFDNREHPNEYRIFKRLHKLMYQEVDRALDAAETEYKIKPYISPMQKKLANKA